MTFGVFKPMWRYWTGIEKRWLPVAAWGSDPLTFWRERILFMICFIAGAFGPVALIPSVWLSYVEGLWGVLLLDLAAYAAVLTVLFGRHLPFAHRAAVTCTIFYTLGIGILFALGPNGAGYIWLFGASVLISAIIGFRAAIWTLALNAAALVAVGVYIAYGQPSWALHLENALEKWVVMTANFLLLNALVTVTTAAMLDGLKAALIREQETSASLKESERKYRLLADNTIDCIWLMDLQTVFTYVNPAIEPMLGYTPEAWVGTRLADHCDAQHLAEMTIELQRGLAEDVETAAAHFETVMINRHGQPVDLEVIAKLVLDDQGAPVAVQGTTRNITERKRFEAQLQQAQKHEAIGTLAGGIAHDFNNILAAMLGYAELAVDDARKGSEQEDHLQEVLTAGRRAKTLIRQILTFARQTQGESRPVRVGTIAKEVLKLLRSTVPTTIAFESRIDSSSMVMTDPTHIHQVLMNICTNAAQAMEDDGGVLTVTLEDVGIDAGVMKQRDGIAPGNYLKLTISDTGPGIAAEVMDRIFDPYFTTKSQGGGTGMGLAVVHGIVNKYGGTIAVDSRVGRGSTFTIHLPAAPKRQPAEPAAEPALLNGSERILFVDDEPAIAEMSRRTLEKLGYSVAARDSSVAALELIRTRKDAFDLVITDMTMPHMTGDKLIRAIRELRPDIKAILCTGYSSKIATGTLTEIGVDAILYKPIVREDLARTIRRVLDG